MAMPTMLADSDDDLADSTSMQIFKSVHHFYIAIVKKMVKIFPFHDTVLKDLSMLNPDPKLRNTWSPTMVRNLTTHFSKVADDEIEHLMEEFQDYQLSLDDDLPAVKSDSHVNMFWAEMGRKKIFVGAVRFPLLSHVMTTLSLNAHSNADSECVFSVVRKIDTDSCSQLSNDTLQFLLSCKINTNDPCHAFVPDKDLCMELCTGTPVKECVWVT